MWNQIIYSHIIYNYAIIDKNSDTHEMSSIMIAL